MDFHFFLFSPKMTNSSTASTIASTLNETVGCNFDGNSTSYIDAVIFIAISLVAILGNTVVLVCYKRFKVLRTVTNIFILSLSMGDLFVATVSIPFSFSVLVCGILPYEFLYIFCDMIPSIWSIYSLTLISLDRMLAVSSPYIHERFITRRAACVAVVIALLLAILCVSLDLVLDEPSFTILVIAVAYIIPITLMLISYFIMGYSARVQVKKAKQLAKTRERLKSSTTYAPTTDSTPCSGREPCYQAIGLLNDPTKHLFAMATLIRKDGFTNHNWVHQFELERRRSLSITPKCIKKEFKAALTLSLVLGCFVFCWTPFMAMNIHCLIIGNECSSQSFYIAIKYLKVLHYANSAFNPILYVLLNKQWRVAFSLVICSGISNGLSRMSFCAGQDSW